MLLCVRYRAWKREESDRRQYDAVVDDFVLAMRYYDMYKARAHKSMHDVKAAMRAAASGSAKVAYLKEQIKMRTLGCGWTE